MIISTSCIWMTMNHGKGKLTQQGREEVEEALMARPAQPTVDLAAFAHRRCVVGRLQPYIRKYHVDLFLPVDANDGTEPVFGVQQREFASCV